jgi:hypothetical protein
MFWNHASGVLDAHAPDVLTELAPAPVAPRAPAVSDARPEILESDGCRIVMPPFAFGFTIVVDEAGEVSIRDDLGDDSVILCLPFDSSGTSIRFDPEIFASAFAFLSLTARPVFGRPAPGASTLFEQVPGAEKVQDAIREVDLGPGKKMEFSLIYCGRDFWVDGMETIVCEEEHAKLGCALRRLLDLGHECLGRITIRIDDVGRCACGGFEPLTPHAFLANKNRIVRSIAKQVAGDTFRMGSR